MSNKFSMSLNLNLDKSRDAEFKKYLDNNTKAGINRKESILRLFEMLCDENPIPLKHSKSDNVPKDVPVNSLGNDVSSDDFEGI